MIKKIFVIMLGIMLTGALSAQAANITMNKRVWKLGERIEVKYSGTSVNLRYKISAFKRGTTNNSNPIKTRSFKNKTSGSVFMRLKEDQGVTPGNYEFHLYRSNSNSILSKIYFVLTNGGTDPNPPVDPPVDPPTGNNNFTASSGTTDLNYADTTTFISEYSKLGFKNLQYQKTVRKSQLASMLAAKNNMHFHSGHGAPNGTINCTDGDLAASSLSGKIQVKYSIYCICSSFASSNWSRVMGSNAQMVMGFNKTVTDGSCLSLATKFPAQIKSGQSYLMAWYKSNAAISGHKDRWATYVKQGSSVVLYKAGGKLPSYKFKGTPVFLSDQVIIDSVLLEQWNDKPQFAGFSENILAEEISMPTDDLDTSFPREKIYITEGDAKSLAKDTVKDLVKKVRLDSITPIERCETSNNCFVVAYQVSFVHRHNGLSIRSNSIADYATVLVTDDGVVSVDLLWSQLTPLETSVLNRTSVATVSEVLKNAADNISNMLREPVVIAEYTAVYGVSTNEYGEKILIPAYEFIGTGGERFVIDAVTGDLIK